MKRFLFFLSPLLLLCTAVLLQETQAEVNPVVRPINHLAVGIHKKLSAKGGNVFFSPLSISSALGMLYYGARNNTAKEMRRALGFQNANLTDSDLHSAYQNLVETFSQESADEYHLYIANAALIQKGYPILSDYKTGLQKIYQATTREVDFLNDNSKITHEINDWVKNQTHNQIETFLNEGDLDRRNTLVLLNAVYFKGTWETPFDPRDTSERKFYNRGLKTEKTLVPMMSFSGEVRYARSQGVKVIELPYNGGHISMVILLPVAFDGLKELEQKLTPDTIRDMRLLTHKKKLYVVFPKFKLEFEKDLKSVLQNLGMHVFGGDSDFSGVTEAGQIRVSAVIHKAVVEVNEEGSQAAAVTTDTVSRSGRPPKMAVNHPFLFAIIDKRTDLILFQGRVEEF